MLFPDSRSHGERSSGGKWYLDVAPWQYLRVVKCFMPQIKGAACGIREVTITFQSQHYSVKDNKGWFMKIREMNGSGYDQDADFFISALLESMPAEQVRLLIEQARKQEKAMAVVVGFKPRKPVQSEIPPQSDDLPLG